MEALLIIAESSATSATSVVHDTDKDSGMTTDICHCQCASAVASLSTPFQCMEKCLQICHTVHNPGL